MERRYLCNYIRVKSYKIVFQFKGQNSRSWYSVFTSNFDHEKIRIWFNYCQDIKDTTKKYLVKFRIPRSKVKVIRGH